MRLRALFIGLAGSRAKNIAGEIERAASLSVDITILQEAKHEGNLADRFDAVFLNTDIGYKTMNPVLTKMRQENPHLPIILTYGAEPDGRTFQLARRHDCWLFSEIDRMHRGLAPHEIGEGLRARLEAGDIGSRLMEISLCSGPCSTGE